MSYLKLKVSHVFTSRRLYNMLAKLKTAVLKLESASASLNNRTVRYAMKHAKRG